MLDRDTFREEYDASVWDDRPRRIQQLRAEFDEHLDKRVPRSLADVPEWYTNHKASITRMLAEHDDGEDDEETDESDAEGEGVGGDDADEGVEDQS